MPYLFLLLFSMQASAATLVTETVGQVADHVVTSREVQIAMVIEHVLFPTDKSPKRGTLYEVRPGQSDFRSAMTNVLLESVVALEAENFNVSALAPDAVSVAVTQIEKATIGKVYWAQMEVSGAELKRMTTRKLMAKNFWKFKTSSMSGIITDQEAQDYYEKNRVKFGSTSFEAFRDNIKNFLAQQQLEERIRAWFEVIKRKYKVRSFISE